MERVVFNNNVLEYFDKLVFVLFDQNYFSNSEYAQRYVDKLVTFVIENLSKFPNKKSPPKLQYLGSYYIFYKSSPGTTWYIFFESKENLYLVTGIENSYSPIIQHLNL